MSPDKYQRFVQKEGYALEQKIKERVEDSYALIVVGKMRKAISEYGFAYEQLGAKFSLDRGSAMLETEVLDLLDLWIADHPGLVFVWRLLPNVTVGLSDNKYVAMSAIKVRLRGHTLHELPTLPPKIYTPS